MRIDGMQRSSNLQAKPGIRRSAGGRFSIPDFDPPPHLASLAPMMPAGGIDIMLALQAVEDSLNSQRRGIRKGRSVLDLLDQLKADLLAGQVEPEKLDALVAQLADLRERRHPGLDAVLAEIDQRARVELAKLGRFPP